MLRLTQQIGGDPVRVVVAIRDHENFARPCHHVDADHAIKLALGFCDPGVARSGDNIDLADPFRTVGERGHGLCPADAPDLVDPGDMGSRQNQRIDVAFRRGCGNDETLHPGNPCRDRVHQKGRRIGCAAPGNIQPGGITRPPARPQAHADIIGVVAVRR